MNRYILVISRYNENLEWLNEKPFSSYKAIVYNKGTNDNFEKNNVIKIVNLKNVGMEPHTYLYHILTEYSLDYDFTIFLPGSVNTNYKKIKAIQIFNTIKNNHKLRSIFIADQFLFDGKKKLFDFSISKYTFTNSDNLKMNNNININPAQIRPFGKWLESKFPDNKKINHITYNGIFAISKKDLMNNTRDYYLKFYNELNTECHPEEVHYIERCWIQVFNIRDPIIKYGSFYYYLLLLNKWIIINGKSKYLYLYLFIVIVIIILILVLLFSLNNK
jgi:hypothetical protein